MRVNDGIDLRPRAQNVAMKAPFAASISSGSQTIVSTSSCAAGTPLGVIRKPSRQRALTLPDVP